MRMKRQITDWKKIFAKDTSDKGLLPKAYRELWKLNIKKISKLISKWAKDLNRPFTKDIQMTNKHLRRYSTSYVTRELQTEATVRYHHTPIIIAKIESTANFKCWQSWEQQTLSFITRRNAKWHSHLERQLAGFFFFFPKLNVLLPYDPTIPVLSYLPKKLKTYVHPKA